MQEKLRRSLAFWRDWMVVTLEIFLRAALLLFWLWQLFYLVGLVCSD
ncbi:hypothetical protein OU995_05885 [Roseateles sp. SL47]|nr:hypothetical protein [Roseateles sp. SL47]WAC74254.1 hypothetical protein OU995_05885 [Roseateles sp. SL47]